MSLLRFRVIDSAGSLRVLYENGVDMGVMYVEVDGYYVYQPIQRFGYWSAEVMRAVADTLDVLNKPWDRIVNADIDEDDSVGCEVCGDPVLYGSRHHRCGSAVMEAEKRGYEQAMKEKRK